MKTNPAFDNGRVIPGETIGARQNGRPAHAPKTLVYDMARLIEWGNNNKGKVAAAAAAVLALTSVVGHDSAPSQAVVCVDPNTKIKGSDFGGTVSGIAADQLNSAVAKGRASHDVSPSAIPNFDAALVELTNDVAGDIGTRQLSADGSYQMSQETCVSQNPETLQITVTSPEAK